MQQRQPRVRLHAPRDVHFVERDDASGTDASPHSSQESSWVGLMDEDVPANHGIERRCHIEGIEPVHQELDIVAGTPC